MSSKECCDIKAAEFRDRLTIQVVSRTRDGQGGWTESWSTFATVWGMVKPLSAREIFFSESLQHRVTHKVITRYITDIASDMRITFDGGRILEIEGYRNPDGRKRFHEIMCEERSEVDNQPEQPIETEAGEDLNTEASEDITTEG
jgi:SPP1 family predicted phage head-tail adaptor